MTTPRGPESTVLRMVGNAMHIQNIEVETGWTPDEIKTLAMRNGYALDAASKRFRRAPQPKPAPVGIVRTSQTSTGAEVVSSSSLPDGFGDAGLALSETDAAAPVLPQTSGEEVSASSRGAVAIASPSARLVETSTPSSPEPDPTVVAAIAFVRAFAELLALIDERPAAESEPETTAKRAGNYPTGPRITHGATQSQIRDWARTQGLDVNPRGTVRRGIADAYAAAHPTTEETP